MVQRSQRRALPARAVVGDLNLAKMDNFFSPVTDGRSAVDFIAAHEISVRFAADILFRAQP